MELTLARREKMKAAVAYIGGSGTGKTLSMLLTAYGMMKEAYPDLSEIDLWQRIGVVDTEHNRAKLYAGTTKVGVAIHPFYHIDLQAPYSPSRYDEAVQKLKRAGCEVVILDSVSHAWEGSGGILDMKESFGDNFQAWGKVKPHMQSFVRTLTENDVHILVSMRTKQDYQVEAGDTGKLEIKKLGLKPIQKDDLEYEFMIVWRIDQDHIAKAVKDNSGMFENLSTKITPEYGAKLYKWLEEGVDVKAEEEAERQRLIEEIEQQRQEHEAVEKLMKELEFKAKKPITELQLVLVKKAYMMMKDKIA